ncbi:MAG: (d)CMP kinase [Gammaproteobacteria bacterium]|nr:(d)CMP kinase [Gammaproteobacteria bacterium]
MNNAQAVPVVALDGPGGAGKGTLGQALALRLGWHYLDSGALYRAVALCAQRQNIGDDDRAGLENIAETLDFACFPGADGEAKILLGGHNVSVELRSEECGAAASVLAARPELRNILLNSQRAARQPPGLVADGRDMGSVVFPDAVLKVFLTASTEVRAVRRYKQLKNKGLDVNLPRLERVIRDRDRRDSEREVAPLQAQSDAILVDTSTMRAEEVLQFVISRLRRRLDCILGNCRIGAE